MQITMKKKPSNVTVISGFPGFGLVGTIAAEFLIEHLKCEKIGSFYFEEAPATIAIHNERVISPVEVHYNKASNIAIIHSITAAPGTEWKAADMILEVCKQLKAKELISLEGVGSAMPTTESNVYYHSTSEKNAEKIKKTGLKSLKEGIIIGVTAAMLAKASMPTTCFFAETHTALPDSKAAAAIVTELDKYLGLKVDPKPLLKQAEKFEQKLQDILQRSKQAEDIRDKKQMSYVG